MDQHLTELGIEIAESPLGANVVASDRPEIQVGDILTGIGFVDPVGRSQATTNFTTERLQRIVLGSNRQLIFKLVRDQTEELTVPVR